MQSPGPDGIPRLPSGVAGLDTILRGGFLQNGVYIFQGAPGAGKTILANEIAYTHAARGGRALYVTLLAETHARMLLHLRSMRFFDPSRIPDAISYISGFRTLEEDGLKGLLTLLRREVQAQGATVLLLDGLVVAENEAPTEVEFKKFIHELQAQASLSNCTMFLLTSGQRPSISPEHTMVDGVIDLRDEIYGAQAERAIEVRKFRGVGYLRGRHTFRITPDGLLVFPRIEGLYQEPSGPTVLPRTRVSTGVRDLDAMLQGGFLNATTTAVFGPSGAGKTVLGLQFLSTCSADEPGLFFGFFETPERLNEQARVLGLPFSEKVEQGHVEVLWQGATERIMDELGHRLLEAVRRRGVRRLFVDGFGGFIEPVTQPDRISRQFAAVANELRVLGVTAIYTLESKQVIGGPMEMPVAGISSLVENAILLRFAEHQTGIRRALSIIKVRNSDYDSSLRELVIGDGGITLPNSFQGVEAVLSGFARKPVDPVSAPASRPRPLDD